MKTIESRIAPNPMEAQIWVDLSADAHGLVKKYWDGTKWITKGGNSTSKEEILKSLEPQFKEIKDQFNNIISRINFLSNRHDEYVLKLIKELTDRIIKLEKFIVTE